MDNANYGNGFLSRFNPIPYVNNATFAQNAYRIISRIPIIGLIPRLINWIIGYRSQAVIPNN